MYKILSGLKQFIPLEGTIIFISRFASKERNIFSKTQLNIKGGKFKFVSF